MSNSEKYMNDFDQFLNSVLEKAYIDEEVARVSQQNTRESLGNPDYRQQQYPYSDSFEFITKLEKINLDEECRKDLETGNGFRCSSARLAASSSSSRSVQH